MTTSFPTATISGYPRIGQRRELKRALESFWAGQISEDEYQLATRNLRAASYDRLSTLGLSEPYSIPADFSAYDHLLDTALTCGIIAGGSHQLESYFALARGTATQPPLEMTKWFDTNYHYLVPEIADDHRFHPAPDHLLGLVAEARATGHTVRPVLVGPLTLLALSKPAAGANQQPLQRVDELVEVYAQVLAALHAAGVHWVQIDEPILVADLTTHSDAELAALAEQTYRQLLAFQERPQIFLNTPYGALNASLPVLAALGCEALGVDLSAATRALYPDYLQRLQATQLGETVLVAGLVDGRNVWAADLQQELTVLQQLAGTGSQVVPSTSTSLLHVPYTVAQETALPVDVACWLSFAEEKVSEVTALAAAAEASGTSPADAAPSGSTPSGTAPAGTGSSAEAFSRSARAVRTRQESRRVHNPAVASRQENLADQRTRVGTLAQRQEAQSVHNIPNLPTTTIGSFPQTSAVRAARAGLRSGALSEAEYTRQMHDEIASVVALQERLGLDVIVHGEPERNDMVQYFAEHLAGFATTDHGWVQSYGSRCTRPPILYGDVSRPAPITVPWSQFAAGLTDKPVKGMLTGPVTILAWSFVRDDQPLARTAEQVALALSDEVTDLEQAGIGIIQVDEPALRELLPLRQEQRDAYLNWAVAAFRLVSAQVQLSTQIHTHLCYSEFAQVIEAVNALDADVTSIEAARSRMELLADLAQVDFAAGLGPGVYDIHSPRVPSVSELVELIEKALASVPAHRLWINPDCGLKTRGYAEVEQALGNLVTARNQVRDQVSGQSGDQVSGQAGSHTLQPA